jgi:hypothetical protein
MISGERASSTVRRSWYFVLAQAFHRAATVGVVEVRRPSSQTARPSAS